MNHDWKLESDSTSGDRSWRCAVCLGYMVGSATFDPRGSGECVGGSMMDPATPTAKYEIGEMWYSNDNGRSFRRGQYVRDGQMGKPAFVVTSIDRKRGSITLGTIK
jgi:hypothetical protein